MRQKNFIFYPKKKNSAILNPIKAKACRQATMG